VLEPIFQNWLQTALLVGAITMPNGSALPAAKADKFARHEWQPRRWDWVDPKADTEANILKVRAGLMAPQDLAASMGYDFDDVLASIKAAQDLAASYGITLPAYDALPGAVGGGQATAQDNAQPVQASKELDGVMAELRSLRELAARPPAPAPVINVGGPTVNLPEQRHEHHTHVQAPPPAAVHNHVEVRAPEQPAPIVNVAAPEVHVEAVIQPADVVVNNTHPARAIQTVERDKNDEITRTVTTYEA
jgi:hypothetical protein